MDRKEELLKIFKDTDTNVCEIVHPLIDELLFIEGQLEELKKQPFIKVHPTNPANQKQTPAGKLYKDLLASYKDIVRILCSQLHKGGEKEGDSLFRAWVKKRNV